MNKAIKYNSDTQNKLNKNKTKKTQHRARKRESQTVAELLNSTEIMIGNNKKNTKQHNLSHSIWHYHIFYQFQSMAIVHLIHFARNVNVNNRARERKRNRKRKNELEWEKCVQKNHVLLVARNGCTSVLSGGRNEITRNLHLFFDFHSIWRGFLFELKLLFRVLETTQPLYKYIIAGGVERKRIVISICISHFPLHLKPFLSVSLLLASIQFTTSPVRGYIVGWEANSEELKKIDWTRMWKRETWNTREQE